MAALTDILAPLEQEGTKSVVRKWLAAVGDRLAINDPIVELETDKVSVEVAAEQAGVLAEIVLDSGASAEPGALLGRMSTDGAGAAEGSREAELEMALPAGQTPAMATPVDGVEEPARSEAPARSIASFDRDLRLSPSVRRRLADAQLDPAGLAGSGRGGRLTRADVDAAVEQRGAAPAPAAAAAAKPGAAPRTPGGVTTLAHDSMRLRIAEHMSHSLSTAPHVTAVFEADFSAIMAHRKAQKAEYEKRGVNLTLTAYMVAACVKAMEAAPAVNGRWFQDRLEIYDDINIGVGTALGDKGLVVPVVHRAQTLALFGVAQRLHEMTERARANRLAPADMQGGTFTISNHGVSGSLLAAPIIINQPQSAILGVGKLEKRVVVRQVDGSDAIVIRPMAYVSLSIDHRVLDGHQTNAWLTRLVDTLESWKD